MKLNRRCVLKAVGSTGTISAITPSVAGADTGSTEVLRIGTVSREVHSLRPRVATGAVGNAQELILDAIFDRGIEYHPETAEPVDWAFKGWEVIGDTEVRAYLRTDLQFSDGEDLTAEDVVTTMRVARTYTNNSKDKGVAEVKETEAVDTYEVRFTLKDPEPPETFLRYPILPSHIWQPLLENGTIDDYRPTEHGGPIGTGPFELAEATFDVQDQPHTQEFILSARHGHPLPRDAAYLDGNGPFVNRVRIRIYQAKSDLVTAHRNGTEDLALEVGHRNIDEFGPTSNINLGDTSGYSHISYNLRRVPLDDKPFRQALGTVFDDEYLEKQFNGVHVAGDLPLSDSSSYYRPYATDDPEVEQYTRPETDSGGLDISEIRHFLETADGAHDYTFGDVVNDEIVAGDVEIRVDGQLLTEVYSPPVDGGDDDGGAGPLIFSRNSTEAQPEDAEVWDRWVTDLQEVGIPIVDKLDPFFGGDGRDGQVHEVYRDEDFDIYEMGWAGTSLCGGSLNPLFHSTAADLPGKDDNGFHMQPMGYSGADELIEEVEQTLEPEERLQKIEQALMKIYEDQPSYVTRYRHHLEVLDDDWTGWTAGYARGSGQFPLVSIRPGR